MLSHILKRGYCTITNNNKIYDVTIIGAGIVGMATARELKLQYPDFKVMVVEKENEFAKHQSSHNSGVIHCGIYYKPGSTRAKLCAKGSEMMIDYCKSKSIAHEQCGKLIVATKKEELEPLEILFNRGKENGVKDLQMISRKDINKYEPYIDGGIKAIYCPTTGIVNYKHVTASYVNDFKELGGELKLNFNVKNIDYSNVDKLVRVSDGNETIQSRYLITCAGMYSDRVSKMTDSESVEPSIVPFRGSFMKFKSEYSHLIKGNVYPVPNPQFPFLGIHFTKKVSGDIWLGPNAVLAFHREGYSYKDISLQDLKEMITHGGLLKLSAKHWKFGARELARDIFNGMFIQYLKPYMTNITEDMIEYAGSGVRSQAISQDGNLIEDFIFDQPPNLPILHVRNSPSPSATSSLAISKEILSRFNSTFFPDTSSSKIIK
ncbi:hypothetical protein DLAC_02936 [Tieghemostelium lacteum]|uniref:L-2-hydroxyglutarate dehydrogenase, mitochondrial n=1 Tax=Tieghemostelium lacteum TaxID=361077 RepID=A0A152A3S7_TIELA|nr:hypothetical protein DLAC_02936 [Tieghemostelium lacteum]|eukprot:KYR00876.1 hypothetical protein DLAC_02936 [Tieghemostelium lacteum]